MNCEQCGLASHEVELLGSLRELHGRRILDSGPNARFEGKKLRLHAATSDNGFRCFSQRARLLEHRLVASEREQARRSCKTAKGHVGPFPLLRISSNLPTG